ncbi:hypothetical protein D9756_004793 [Leucocoprinus leucothites]|uniref:F-box domain-containing protein n=1 Tax=Leucocoprinus leucothites TaxID=201217 RepID=A0A8H5LKJ4_9AGAR|nr:hypothetical protein D9756_004793 [Leucoagaricus leucothites]
MPSALRKTQDRALNLSRSLANALKSKFTGTSRAPRSSHPYIFPDHDHISRPRHLRRAAAEPVINVYNGPYRRTHRHFIHRLPIELLSHIFVLGAEEDPHLPLSVSQVCRSWRHVALSTPTLWRRIVLSPHEYMWRERIRRARACTLDIELLPTALTPIRPRPLHYYPRRHLDFYSVQWLMQIALPHLHRWRSLEVMFMEQSPYLLNAALSFLADLPSPPSLREMTLIHRLNEDPQPFILFNGYAPSLKKLVLDGPRMALFPDMFINLTYLDYTHHRFSTGSEAIHEILSLLSLCPKLISLRLLFPHQFTNLTAVYHKPPRPNSRVSLSSLNQLNLALDPNSPDIPYELALLLTHLSTPVLHTIKFSDPARRQAPFPNLKSFFWMYAIPRSLRFIHIEGGWFDSGMVDPIVKSLPRLRKMILRRGGWGSERVIYHETQASALHRGDYYNRDHTHKSAGRFAQPVAPQMHGSVSYQEPSSSRRHGTRQRVSTYPYGAQATSLYRTVTSSVRTSVMR